MDIDNRTANKLTLIDKAIGKLKVSGLFDNFVNKWEIPINNITQINNWKEDLIIKGQYKKCQDELRELGLKADWPRDEIDTLEDNIILGIYVYKHERTRVELVTNELTKEKELYIRIFGNTTKDDLRNTELWKIILNYKKSLHGYVKSNYPDKGNHLRQKELEMRKLMKPAQIADKLANKIDSQVDIHPEISKLYETMTGLQVSKNIHKQKKILGIKGKK